MCLELSELREIQGFMKQKIDNISIAAIEAIIDVEAMNEGFCSNGSIIISFQRDVFYSYLQEEKTEEELKNLVRNFSNIVSPESGGYYYDEKEYTRLGLARSINENAALKATKWGMFELFGHCYKQCGYDQVGAFTFSMRTSKKSQVMALASLIVNNETMTEALKKLDWEAFSLAYNGLMAIENGYSVKLDKAYRRHKAYG